MRFIQQRLEGVFLIEPSLVEDKRGVFHRHFCQREFERHGLLPEIRQCNVSENHLKHTLRGFHYQSPPHGEGKTLSCLRGAIYDVVVDLRPASATYRQWLSLELTEENRRSLYLPPGCANAFLTLEDRSTVFYCHSEFYAPGAEKGVRYDDPQFDFKWPHEPVVISDKDRSHPDYRDEGVLR
ncbi:MAG: dTDP-4-dehydrorhamnose 3,5-epimerase family protein [Elusimicrobia bacterium]|nr:dTDP-4-dehydrorhamnose 3,5-epimerase family protein [Elusimicrobiota bacterium]